MNRLRMAVVGVGSLGQHHAAKLAVFEDVELVAVVDPGTDQCEAVAAKNGCLAVSSILQLPADLDGVIIAAPTTHHLVTARHFLNQGIATFVEKPLATNLSEAEQLLAVAERNSAVLQVGHIERFNPAFQILKEQCRQPMYLRCQRVSPYTFRSTDIGVVHDLMIHDIDLALALTGEMPSSIDAFGAIGIGPCEDMAVARLKMPGGCIVDLTASRMCPTADRRLQVWSQSGFTSANLQTREVTHWQACDAMKLNPAMVHAIAAATPDPRTLKDKVFSEWIQPETCQGNSEDQMSLELRDFVAAIQDGKRPEVTGSEGLQAMQVAEQVVESLNLWSYQSNTQPGRAAA